MADISMSFFSTMMSRNVTIKVVIPFDLEVFTGIQGPYKTLYFLPGYSADAQSIITQTILAERAATKGFAVVIPDGENSFYTDQTDIRTHYEKYVTEELIAVTRKMFPLSDKREDTFIGGISMGGFGCLMLGSRHTSLYSKILAMSPATFPYARHLAASGFTSELLDRYFKSEEYYMENYHPMNLLKKAAARGADLPKIFMCCGQEDPLTYEMDCTFANEAKQNDIAVEYHESSGTHDTEFWNSMLPAAIDFMLKS